MFVGKNFLPADDQSQFNVLVRTPEGTSLAATTAVAEGMRTISASCPGCHTLHDRWRHGRPSANNATIYVKLTDIEQRSYSQGS